MTEIGQSTENEKERKKERKREMEIGIWIIQQTEKKSLKILSI